LIRRRRRSDGSTCWPILISQAQAWRPCPNLIVH